MSRADAIQRDYSWDSDGGRDEILGNFSSRIHYLARCLVMRLPSSVQAEDLINAGTQGLMDAMEKFDPGRGVQFGTYAEFRIKGAMMDELRNMDWLPRSMRRKANMLRGGAERARTRFGRQVTEEEIAHELGMETDEYQKLKGEAGSVSVISIEDMYAGYEEGRSALETIADADALDPLKRLGLQEARQALASAVEGLPEQERLLVSLYYFEDLNMKEIGSIMGFTESRASQLHTRAMGRLKLRLRNFRQA